MSRSLKLHIILDGFHTLDLLRDFHRLVDVVLGVDETAQLNDTLKGINFDLQGFKAGFVKNGGLHLSGDDSVV